METERELHNKFVLKLSGFPLYCFSRDLSNMATKLNAQYVHVPRLRGTLTPSTTAQLYFDNESDMNKALQKPEQLDYQDCKVYLSVLKQKTCYSCGYPAHEIKNECC